MGVRLSLLKTGYLIYFKSVNRILSGDELQAFVTMFTPIILTCRLLTHLIYTIKRVSIFATRSRLIFNFEIKSISIDDDVCSKRITGKSAVYFRRRRIEIYATAEKAVIRCVCSLYFLQDR